MHRLEWSQALSTGDHTIDLQLQHLFALTEQIRVSIKEGVDQTELQQLVLGVLRYATTHFEAEEEFMRNVGYRDLSRQRRLHNAFVLKLNVLAKECFEGDPQSVAHLYSTLAAWLHDHVMTEDRKLADFMHEGETAKRRDTLGEPAGA